MFLFFLLCGRILSGQTSYASSGSCPLNPQCRDVVLKAGSSIMEKHWSVLAFQSNSPFSWISLSCLGSIASLLEFHFCLTSINFVQSVFFLWHFFLLFSSEPALPVAATAMWVLHGNWCFSSLILCPDWTWSRSTFVYSLVCQVSSTDISEDSQMKRNQNWPQYLSSLLLGHFINLYSCSIPSLWEIPKSPTAALTALLNCGPGF